MSNESVVGMWEKYKKNNPNVPEYYEAWAFGHSIEMADKLAKLVLDGLKTATSSNYLLYGENDALSYVGLHNILLDGNEEAVAIVETTFVEIIPFNEVTKEHAFLEGEGDRSLDYWRRVHKDFFEKELKEINQEFNHKIPVVCERFKLIYKK
ncbi:ASCH domain-containing protein [Pseudogracilibacillus auburnensis]|uniref:ASCH domain-containing protein n=1 Tax=Pseudogracilibacillus auburnensis TaxID=1494959 RepID=UPI001A960B56|nr:ASCH domain-containing protein [Pseudogracilibacillus auburnensis]MBO1004573.1 ASCH domain-containing protein [Pseudogracilibacillus auburnensis]